MGLFKNKKKLLVGLDIGSSGVKVCELQTVGKGSAQRYRLQKLGFAPVPHDAIVDGDIMDSNAVVGAVRQVLAELTALAPDDPALTRCLLSVMGPCAMLLIGAGGLPGPVQETLQMPREVIVRHLHSYALAGLAAIAREHER